MHDIAPLIRDLAIMLGIAGIVALLFQRIRQPVVLGYLIAGVIIGPYTPPHSLVNDVSNIQILSELGVIFLMFSLGLEFSFQKLTRVGFSASVTGLLEVILMTSLGFVAGSLIGWSFYDCLFLGAALSMSSTTIIIKAIDELGLKTKRFAELIFGILVAEDLLAILMLVALSTVVITKNVFSMDMVMAALKLIMVVGGWFLVGYFIVPSMFRRVSTYITQETLTIVSVALCLTLVTIAAYFHYSTALGAFIMGSILAETTLVHRIEHLIRPIRDIFAAVFFISVGMLIDPNIIIQHWGIVIFVALITIFGKLVTTGVAAFLTGQSLTTSVRVGFGMAQVGEFSFIIVALGLSLKVTNDIIYPIIVAVSGVTTFTTPYLIRFSGTLSQWLETKLPANVKYFLESYSAWVFRAQTSSQKNNLWGKVSIRLVLNGIIVAIIFTLVHKFIFPHILSFTLNLWRAQTLTLLVALVLASPFIWGMLFSYRLVKIPEYTNTTLNPAICMIWFITLAEITILSIVYFNSWVTGIFFAAISIAFFIFSFQHLERSYHWFEKQLISNIKSDAKERERYDALAPWDTHLVEIEVGEHSPFVGKSLKDCHVRQLYGVNVVAICHGERIIPAPRGEEKIIPHDKLIVLGNDEQIDAFRARLETKSTIQEETSFLGNFKLKAFLLDSHHPLIGKTIRSSLIREFVNGLVVGLERENIRILNPDPETILQQDDLVLVVGEVDRLDNLNTNMQSGHN